MAHPLFTDEHEMLRRSIHAFVEKEIAPRVAEWETAGRIPRELWRRLGELGFLAARTGAGPPDRRHAGISMFLVERGLPGFTVSRKLDNMGMRASDTAELAFQDCPVPAENLLGVEGRGFQQLAAGLQRERLMAAVLARSGADQALEDTMSHLRERTAFGEPLAQRQVLRHRVADLATELAAARELVYHAIRLFAAGEECVREVSMAKLFATEVANRVAYEAVQMHGGYG